jgi:hypothetical protein
MHHSGRENYVNSEEHKTYYAAIRSTKYTAHYGAHSLHYEQIL